MLNTGYKMHAEGQGRQLFRIAIVGAAVSASLFGLFCLRVRHQPEPPLIAIYEVNMADLLPDLDVVVWPDGCVVTGGPNGFYTGIMDPQGVKRIKDTVAGLDMQDVPAGYIVQTPKKLRVLQIGISGRTYRLIGSNSLECMRHVADVWRDRGSPESDLERLLPVWESLEESIERQRIRPVRRFRGRIRWSGLRELALSLSHDCVANLENER